MHARELIGRIERTADPRRAASWDRSGVQIAGTVSDCARLAVALDPLPTIIEAALDWGAACILTHHPLLLTPRLPDRLDDYHAVLRLVLGRGAWLYAAHTSLDVVTDGPAGWLADALGLRRRRVLEPAGRIPHLAGRWRAPAHPAAGAEALSALPGVTAMTLGPDLVEAVFAPAVRDVVTARLEAACPGATLVSLAELAEPADVYGYGLVGDLPEPLPYAALENRLAGLLPRRFFTLAGETPPSVARLAYCPGSGADMAPRAFAAGADVYLTGDLKYHQAQAVPPGRCIVDVGHFSLEEVMMRTFANDLAGTFGENGPLVRYFSGNDPFSAHYPDGATPSRTE